MSSIISRSKESVANINNSFQFIRQLYKRGNVNIYLCEQKSPKQLVVIKHTRRGVMKTMDSQSPKIPRLVIPNSASNQITSLILNLIPDSIENEQLFVRLIQDRGGHRNILNYVIDSTLLNSSSNQDTYLVMEYCKRGDLFSLLEQQCTQRFDEATALHFFKQIVEGVHFLHQSVGIAHRDISLENILIDDQWCLKICDFGLSTMVNQRSNETVGKLFYMAPEIVSRQVYDPIQADIWSLGIVLFIMLTGSPLYHIAHPCDRAWKAVERLGIGGLLKQWELDHHISPSTVALLTTMLQTNPSKRPSSLDGVLQHMKIHEL